eukprot:8654140-Pyramimonas_sp.AAC.1
MRYWRMGGGQGLDGGRQVTTFETLGPGPALRAPVRVGVQEHVAAHVAHAVQVLHDQLQIALSVAVLRLRVEILNVLQNHDGRFVFLDVGHRRLSSRTCLPGAILARGAVGSS